MRKKTTTVTPKRSDQIIARMTTLCHGVSLEQQAATAFVLRDYCNNLLGEIEEEFEVDTLELEAIEEDEE